MDKKGSKEWHLGRCIQKACKVDVYCLLFRKVLSECFMKDFRTHVGREWYRKVFHLGEGSIRVGNGRCSVLFGHTVRSSTSEASSFTTEHW